MVNPLMRVSWEGELLFGVTEGRQLVDMSGKGWPSVGVSREVINTIHNRRNGTADS